MNELGQIRLSISWVGKRWFAEVTESTKLLPKFHQGAEATGLVVGTPVVAGGGDCAAQAVGSSIVQEGKVSVTLGTSGVVFAQSDEYRVEPGETTFVLPCGSRKMAFDGSHVIRCRFFPMVQKPICKVGR